MSETAAIPVLLKKRMRHTRWFILLLLPLALFSIGLAPVGGWADEALGWIGLVFVIICVLGRSYCSAYIGGIKNDRVVREGPFGMVRNPLYVFSFLGVVGIGIQSDMFTVFVMLVGAFMLYYPRVVAREEAFLLHKFGEEYAAYMREVPRWIPDFSKWNEPAELVIRPYFLRHTMLDATIFFLPMALFELLELMHSHGVLPSYLLLP